MSTFTLTDLKAEVEKKYAPVIIEDGDEKFILPNLLQLDAKVRREVLDLLDTIDTDEDDEDIDDQLEVFSALIRLLVSEGKGDKFLELLGGNTALVIEIANKWMDGTQLGEAERSSE